MHKRFFVMVFGLFIFLGCSQSTIVPFEESSECQTTVEGNYFAGDSWDGEAPAIILPGNPEPTWMNGALLNITEDSVTFDGNKQGPFYDPEPNTWSLDEVQTVIDSSGRVIHGFIPAKLSNAWRLELHVVRKEDPKKKTNVMLLQPESLFAFCIEPGTYSIKQIYFKDGKGNIDKLKFPTNFEFTVKADKSNYIGDFYLNIPGGKGQIFDLEFVTVRSNKAALAGALVGGVGGAVASAVISIAHANTHKLRVENNPDFSTQSPSPKVTSIIKLKEE